MWVLLCFSSSCFPLCGTSSSSSHKFAMLCEGAVVSAGWHRSWGAPAFCSPGRCHVLFPHCARKHHAGFWHHPALLPPPHFTVFLVCWIVYIWKGCLVVPRCKHCPQIYQSQLKVVFVATLSLSFLHFLVLGAAVCALCDPVTDSWYSVLTRVLFPPVSHSPPQISWRTLLLSLK